MAEVRANRIDADERLEVFNLGADEQALRERMWIELEPRLGEIMAPMRRQLEGQRARDILSDAFDIDATITAMTGIFSVHYGQPIDLQWMKIAAGVGNWIVANRIHPYAVIALMQLSFARAQAIACEGARDNEDRARRIAVLGAVDHMACELAVARVNRIARYREAERRDELARRMRANIGELVSSTSRHSAMISKVAGRARESTRALAADASEIAAAAEQSAQVMANAARESSELVDSIDRTRSSVGEISRVSQLAAHEADGASEVISALSQHTGEINTVVAMIRNLADLTRMLAFNATIEAAHAGDAGRGFAVVAEEVKALARQTETATDEIVRQVAGIQVSGGRTVEANLAIAQSIGQVSHSTASFVRTMEEQSHQVTTIAAMIDETALTARAMADTVGSIRTAAQEVDVQANRVEDAFADVSRQLALLEAEVDAFLHDIAA